MLSDLIQIFGRLMHSKRIFLSLSRQSGYEQKFIQKAFDSNWISSGGPNVDDFEKVVENYLGQKSFVAALNFGTSNIHLVLIFLGVCAADDSICQSLTISSSANRV